MVNNLYSYNMASFEVYIFCYSIAAVSAFPALAAGIRYCRKSRSINKGYIILVGLILSGVALDMYAGYALWQKESLSRFWLDGIDALNVVGFLSAALFWGYDAFSKKIVLVIGSVIGAYSCIWLGCAFFARGVFESPYLAPMTYMLLLLACMLMFIEYYRMGAIAYTDGEFWLYVGMITYAAGIEVLLLLRMNVATMNPSFVWLPHMLLAVFKYSCFTYAFERAWKQTR